MIIYSLVIAKMSPCGLMTIIVLRSILLILVIASFAFLAIFTESSSEYLSETGLYFDADKEGMRYDDMLTILRIKFYVYNSIYIAYSIVALSICIKSFIIFKRHKRAYKEEQNR
jgi:hypothetical protein